VDLYDKVILDTETSGLGKQDQIVEITILDGRTGLTLLDTLVKPSCRINKHAAAVHGIDDDMIKDAPTWPEIHDLVFRLLKGMTMVAYQSEFDLRMIKQTCKAYDLVAPEFETECAMRWLHSYLVTPKDPKMKWIKLTKAAELYNVEPKGVAHRALCDTIMTRDVILAARLEDQGEPELGEITIPKVKH
jgi:DNA polymerase-3 subunit epsilon